MTDDRAERPGRTPRFALGLIALVTLGGMTSFELVRQALWPDVDPWLSRLLTFAFGAAIAAFGFFALRRFESLRREIEARVEKRTAELSDVNETLRAEAAERQRIESELRRSQHFLGATLGALSARIAVLDEKGNVIAVNTAWERFTGSDPLISPAIGLGGNFLASCDAAAREGSRNARAVAGAIREILATRRQRFWLEYPDRERQRWYLLRISAFETGEPARLVLALEDISKRKRTEEALYQSMTRTQLVLDSAVDGIITIDDRGRIESVNPAAEQIFGYAASELVGRNVGVLMPAPDKEHHSSYIQRYLETGRRKIIGIGREVLGVRKDGSVFPMDLAVSEVPHGDRRSFMGTVRDITERKEMEEALRRERDFAESLVETAQAIVLVLDREGRIVRFNPYLEEISGYRLEEVRGEDWFEIFLPERDRRRIRALFKHALSGTRTRGGINPIVTKDGVERAIEWYDKALEDSDGNVIGILATGQDITDRLQLEEQFRQAQKMEAIGRLAGGVAHDFNTLLSSITGYGEMLLERLAAGDPLRRSVEQILRGAERGAGLTRQLLAFSRRQLLQPRVLDLNAVVADMDEMLRPLIGEDIALVYELEPELAAVKVDAGQIEQVIMNLIVNAVDAIAADPAVRNPHRNGRITVATSNVEVDEAHAERDSVLVAGRYVALRVSDTGCGMDEATRSRIFEPFFTTKEPGKGTGLGLSTVYGIVRQSGGGIAVESRPGEGSTFSVFLLRSDETPERAEAKPEEPPAGAGSETVLLVEDDEMFLELLTEVLEAHGYTVLTAAEPAAALAACENHPASVDLLISDMVMPGMTGTELARHLLHRRPEMRVLLMSGYTDEALEDRGVLASDGAFIQKPFSTKEFIGIVRQVLDRVEA